MIMFADNGFIGEPVELRPLALEVKPLETVMVFVETLWNGRFADRPILPLFKINGASIKSMLTELADSAFRVITFDELMLIKLLPEV